jgi:hypothetical protein
MMALENRQDFAIFENRNLSRILRQRTIEVHDGLYLGIRRDNQKNSLVAVTLIACRNSDCIKIILYFTVHKNAYLVLN